MLFSSKHASVVYLDRNRLDWAVADNSNVVRCLLPDDTIKDLEVINEPLLSQTIQSFIGNYKVASCSLVLVLSKNIIFEKDLSKINADQLNLEIKNFLDTVPFENISQKLFTLEKKKQIVAVNKALLHTVETILKQTGCPVFLILPESMLDLEIAATGLTNEISKKIIDTLDSLKHFNLSESQDIKVDSLHESKKAPPKKTVRKNLAILLGVFILLISILIFMIVKQTLF